MLQPKYKVKEIVIAMNLMKICPSILQCLQFVCCTSTSDVADQYSLFFIRKCFYFLCTCEVAFNFLSSSTILLVLSSPHRVFNWVLRLFYSRSPSESPERKFKKKKKRKNRSPSIDSSSDDSDSETDSDRYAFRGAIHKSVKLVFDTIVHCWQGVCDLET